MSTERTKSNATIEITKQLEQGLTTIGLDGHGEDGDILALRANAAERGLCDPSDEHCWLIEMGGFEYGHVYWTDGMLVYSPETDDDGHLYLNILRCVADFIESLVIFTIAQHNAKTAGRFVKGNR